MQKTSTIELPNSYRRIGKMGGAAGSTALEQEVFLRRIQRHAEGLFREALGLPCQEFQLISATEKNNGVLGAAALAFEKGAGDRRRRSFLE